jgi:beta-lactam-binding protein with PASTA domain
VTVALVAPGCGSSGASSTTTSASTAAETSPPAHRSSARGPRVRVPDIVGERFGTAVNEVEQAGLEQTAPHFTGTIGNPHYNGRCKKILNQSPPPGTRVPKGYTVSIVYGVCPKAIANAHSSLKAPNKH